MFGFSIQGLVTIALVALGIGFGGGYYTAHRFDEGTALKRQLEARNGEIEALQANIKQMKEVLDNDAKTAQADNATIEELKRKANDLEQRISTGVCLTGDDVDKLRNWWGGPKPKAKPSKRPRGNKSVLHGSDGKANAGGNVEEGSGGVDRTATHFGG